MNSCIYNGLVTHTRFKPVKHFLKYKTFSIFLDLDELDFLQKKIFIFSVNKFNIFSFYNRDHGNRNDKSLKTWVEENLKKYNLRDDVNKIKLLCYPRIFGYVFNPLSIFFCYNNNKLKAILYEVKNTFDEQHTYLFKVENEKNIKMRCEKKLYVSPFMDMETYYDFKIDNPTKMLSVIIKQSDKNGIILTATQSGNRKEFSLKQLIKNFFIYPLMTFKIITAIHYEALLLWKKGAKYRSRNNKIKNNLTYESN